MYSWEEDLLVLDMKWLLNLRICDEDRLEIIFICIEKENEDDHKMESYRD
jgi:hypothetical protein